MPITTSCPGCKALFRLPEELAGKQVRCQKCARMFLVPMLGLASESVPAVSEPEAPPAPLPAPPPETPTPAAPAPVHEPIVVAPRPENPPAVKPSPDAPPSRVWLLAAIILFMLGILATGGFASIWVATHLAAPARSMVVAPFRGTNAKDGVDRNQRRFDDGRDNRFDDNRNDPRKDDPRFENKKPFEEKRDPISPIPFQLGPVGSTRFTADRLEFLQPGIDPGRFGNKGPFRLYRVFMEAGKTYNFRLTNAAFDAQVVIHDEFGNEVARFDLHRPLGFSANRTAGHLIWIYSRNQLNGDFKLIIAEVDRVAPQRVNLGKQFAKVDSLSEANPLEPFPNSGPYREYVVTLEANKDYEFEISTNEFDSRLRLYGGKKQITQHFGGGAFGYTAKFTGDHTIRVTSQNFGVGTYTLTITRK